MLRATKSKHKGIVHPLRNVVGTKVSLQMHLNLGQCRGLGAPGLAQLEIRYTF